MRVEPPHVSEHRISEGYVIKGSCDIIVRSPSSEVIILPSFFAIGTLAIEIQRIFLSRDLARPRDQSVK